METEMGRNFVVSVSLRLSSCTGMDFKSNRTHFRKNACAFVYSIPKKASAGQKEFLVFENNFLDKRV